MHVTKVIFIIGLLSLVVLVWWRWILRDQNQKSAPFTDVWRQMLLKKVRYYRALSLEERIRFEQAILQFLEDVAITGIETEVDDTDRLLVAASAMIPLFGFPGWRYRNLNEVLLYAGAFTTRYETREAKDHDRNISGMVGSGAMNRMMILSKPALYQGFEDQRSKNNVGIHEFVHLLDKADGTTDGIPEQFLEQPFIIPWLKMVHQEIKALRSKESDIDSYGATNEAEFFSVVSEYFFSQPRLLEKKHPQLYDALEKIFRQDL